MTRPMLLALPLAALLGSSGCARHGSSTDANDGGTLADVVALAITPPAADVALAMSADGHLSASASFSATAQLVGGGSRDVTNEVAWEIATPATVAHGQASVAAAGAFELSASAGGVSARATFTAHLGGAILGSGASASDQGHLDGTPGATSPAIAYPIDGALFPANLAPITVQVAKSASTQSVARLHFTAAPLVDVSYYAACEPGPNSAGGCYVTLPSALSSAFTVVSETVDVTLQARAAAPDGSQLGESPPIAIAWAATPLTGGLYYWTTIPAAQQNGNTGIARYDFNGDASKPQMIYTDKGSPVDHTDGNTCVGCHAITHDGTRMALTIGGSAPSDWMLLALGNASQIAVRNQGPGGFATATTFSPDDTRMVNMYRGDLLLRGTDASLVDEGPVLASAVSEKKTDAFWSADGKLFAFVSWAPGQNGALAASDVNGLNGDLKTGGQIWMAHSDGQTITDQATLLIPRAAGVTSYYPAISDDSALLVYNQSSCAGPTTSRGYGDGACDGYSDLSSRLVLTTPAGAMSSSLDKANGPPNVMNSWPRFSPDHGTFRGRTLYWIAFSSQRAYGLQLNVGAGDGKPQLWFAAVGFTAGAPSVDPSFPPVWLPGQNADPATPNGNHVPQWVSKAVPVL